MTISRQTTVVSNWRSALSPFFLPLNNIISLSPIMCIAPRHSWFRQIPTTYCGVPARQCIWSVTISTVTVAASLSCPLSCIDHSLPHHWSQLHLFLVSIETHGAMLSILKAWKLYDLYESCEKKLYAITRKMSEAKNARLLQSPFFLQTTDITLKGPLFCRL